MSRGEILDNKGEGRYTVRLKYVVEAVQQEIQALQAALDGLQIRIREAGQAVVEKQAEADLVEDQISTLIPSLKTDLEGTTPKISELQVQLARIGSENARLQYQRDILLAGELTKQKRLEDLQSIPEDETLDAWCADYSEDLQGEIGLIDVNDEGGNPVIIQPGYDGFAEYLPARDVALMHRKAQSGPQVWLNAAILPGMQKWFPRYRVGEIMAISQDVCSVRLDDAFSSAQNLNINQEQYLAEVPIAYMDCNGEVFEEGDRVMVRFTQSGPLVIGFEKEPRACYFPGVAFQPARLDFTNVDWWNYTGIQRTYYGAPYQNEEGQEINYPLGTEWASSSWVATPKAGQLDIHRGRDNNYGTGTWIGNDGSILSWSAPPGRLHEALGNNDNRDWFPELKMDWLPGPDIYYKGKAIDHGISGALVLGAAFYEDAFGQEWLRVFDHHSLFEVKLDRARRPIEPPQLLAEYNRPANAIEVSGWYFSGSGNKAVCTFKTTDDSPQKRIVARFDGAAITDEVVYNQGDVIGQRSIRDWGTMEITEIDEDDDYIDYGQGEDDIEIHQGYSIPVYFDFIGDSEIEVTLEVAAYNRGVIYQKEGFWDESTREEQFSASYSVTSPAASDRLVTSQGQVLAVFPAQSENVSESGSYTYTTEEGESITVSAEKAWVNVSYILRAVDARFNACIAEIYEDSFNFSGAGQPTYEVSGLAVSGSGSGAEKTYEALFVEGQNKSEIFVAEYPYQAPYSDLSISLAPLSGRWGDHDNTTAHDVKGREIGMDQRQLIDFIGYSEDGVAFYSANIVVLYSDDGHRLFYKTGGGNMIDQALAQGDDVFLLNPGLR